MSLEAERAANIKRNQEYLRSLGLIPLKEQLERISLPANHRNRQPRRPSQLLPPREQPARSAKSQAAAQVREQLDTMSGKENKLGGGAGRRGQKVPPPRKPTPADKAAAVAKTKAAAVEAARERLAAAAPRVPGLRAPSRNQPDVAAAAGTSIAAGTEGGSDGVDLLLSAAGDLRL